MTNRLAGAFDAGGAAALRRRDDRVERRAVDRRAAARRRIVRRVDVAVLRVGGRAERLRIGEVADDRMAAARGDARAPSRCRARAPSRRDRRARARRARRRRCIRLRPSERSASRAVYHSSTVPRDTLIDFFHDLARARGDFLVYDDGFRSRSLHLRARSRAPRAASRRACMQPGCAKATRSSS